MKVFCHTYINKLLLSATILLELLFLGACVPLSPREPAIPSLGSLTAIVTHRAQATPTIKVTLTATLAPHGNSHHAPTDLLRST
jgi:hypothetical protein